MKLSSRIFKASMCFIMFSAITSGERSYASGVYNNCGASCSTSPCRPEQPFCMDIDLTASYLYWNVQQDYLGTGAGSFLFGPNIPEIPRHKWDSGFRIEAALANNCSPIGCDFEWTYFKTSTGTSAIFDTAASVFELPSNIVPMNTSWKIKINEFAFDVDYRFCLNPCFTFRPYVGIYGANIRQSQNVAFHIEGITGDVVIASPLTIFRKNNFWGIGPRFGMSANWNFAQQFSLVCDTNFAYLLGRINSANNFGLPSGLPPQIASLLNTSSNIWCTRPMTSTFLGLEWDGCKCGCFTLSASIGYELQYWWNQWRATPATLDLVAVGPPRCGDLAVNGLVASIGVTF